MESAKLSVYIENTIPSYATARPSNDLISAARQVQTLFFWEHRRHLFKLWVSEDVIREISSGDPEAARRRLEFIKDVEVLPDMDVCAELADVYQKLLGIPDRAKVDCLHIARCVLAKIDFLLTWNCGHLGPASQVKICEYNENHELWTTTLVTPEALITFKQNINAASGIPIDKKRNTNPLTF
jgi:hypothetical protein